jgi:hypothetical protein
MREDVADYLAEQSAEAPDVRLLRQAKPIARKPHRCSCPKGDLIPAGERYSLFVYIEDGRFCVTRWSNRCWDDSER